ncbi:MAG: adenylate/guanylate cyclase domain-containing protein [Thermodesulfobacteriota bacterium]
MTNSKSTISERDQFPPPPNKKGHSSRNARNTVVLFTDIVGSTKYFKSHGNIAGRKMLQTHQDLASRPIVEYGGYLVKTLGDSVMAYFFNPRKAVKAAIKIQQGFQSYNEKRPKEKQIHIKIGSHLGEAIIEEKDIFGDVVNMAAKLVQAAGMDQILISQELYEAVKDLSHGLFQLMDVSNKGELPQGESLYEVLWDTQMALALTKNIVVYLKPLLRSGTTFSEIWDNVLASKKDFWEGKVNKEGVLSDKSVVLSVKDPAFCIPVAHNIMTFLKQELGKDYAAIPLPIKVLIDAGFYFRGDKLTFDLKEVDWNKIAPGRMYISHRAYPFVRGVSSFSTVPPFDSEEKSSRVYRILLDSDHQIKESRVFPYQGALIQGNNLPCFYCGDKRHLPVHCPSKQIMEMTDALKRLGYLSLDTINKLFYQYLTGVDLDTQAGSRSSYNSRNSNLLAYQGFYELKTVFQGRFFRILWNSRIEDWDEIRKAGLEEERGGTVWLAQDCIRVGDLAQAEKLLRTALDENPRDYRGFCGMGFLFVEKADFLKAQTYFEEALQHAETNPQKIFLLFLLFRLHYLDNDLGTAEHRVKQILRIIPQCQEALYQDAVLKFYKGLDKEALEKLTALIKGDGEYYVKALIDPELIPFSDRIHPMLENLLIQSRQEAHEKTAQAKKGLEQMETEIGENDEEMKRAQSVFSPIDELLKTDSYLGYRDSIRHAQMVISIVNQGIEERRKRIHEVVYEASHQCKEYLLISGNYPYPSLVRSVHSRLKDIAGRIEEVKKMIRAGNEPDTLRKAFPYAEAIWADLGEIRLRIRRLVMMKKVLLFGSKFLKKSLMFQSFNLLAALILFPVIAHYLNLLFPETGLPRNIWPYQKGLLVMGGIFGIFLASLPSTKGNKPI